jgi:ribosomal protein S18 acetylase RimI-like enzyme
MDLSPVDMAHRLGEALSVYVDAMGYPRGTERQRGSMWLEHTRRSGWRGVAAVDVPDSGTWAGVPTTDRLSDARLLGVAYGYRGAPDQWWQQQVVRGLRHFGLPHVEIGRLMSDYFELTELHIHPSAQGNGLGEALARRLLADRPEANVLLSTPEIDHLPNRAWRLYRRMGFTDVIRGYHFAGDPRAFAILGRTLPL